LLTILKNLIVSTPGYKALIYIFVDIAAMNGPPSGVDVRWSHNKNVRNAKIISWEFVSRSGRIIS